MNRPSLNLLLVTHYYSSHRGGVEIVAREIATRLAKDHAFEIVWAASDVDMPFIAPNIRPEPMRTWNATEKKLGVPYPLWSPSSLRKLRLLVEQADVIHLHDCLYFGSVITSLLARIQNKPVLLTQHIGLVPYRNKTLRCLMEIGNRLCGRIVIGGADRVIYCSLVVRDYFLQRVRHKFPPQIVQNGVDLEVFSPIAGPQRQDIRRQLDIPEDQPVCLFVGRLVEKKGVHLLHKIAAKLKDILWIFAGHGQIQPADWKLPNVRVYPDRSGPSLAELYRAADLLVLPSIGEGFPLVVIEAMACGTPAMVSDDTFAAATTDIRPLLYHERVDSEDDDKTIARWAESIHRVILDRPALRRAGAQAAEIARLNLSWNNAADRYAQSLLEIALHGK